MKHTDNAIEVLTTDFLCWMYTDSYLKKLYRSSTTQDVFTQLSGANMQTDNHKDNHFNRLERIFNAPAYIETKFREKVDEFKRAGIECTEHNLVDAMWEEQKSDLATYEVAMFLSVLSGLIMTYRGDSHVIQ